MLSFCMLCTVGRAGEVYDNAVKVTFLSWLTGSTKLSYERVVGFEVHGAAIPLHGHEVLFGVVALHFLMGYGLLSQRFEQYLILKKQLDVFVGDV